MHTQQMHEAEEQGDTFFSVKSTSKLTILQTHAVFAAHQQNLINLYSTLANAREQYVIFTRIGMSSACSIECPASPLSFLV
jgi:hypothetical protein